MRRVKIALFFSGFLIFWSACEEEKVPLDSVPAFIVEPVTVPPVVNIGKPRYYEVAFRVSHPDGLEAIAEAKVMFLGSDQNSLLLELPLYDDGGALFPEAMDVIAGDGVFTNRFFSDSLIFPAGEVFIVANATDNSQELRQSEFLQSLALVNVAPLLLSVAAPDTLVSGSQPLLFSATAQDSNGIDDVSLVIMHLKQQNNLVATESLDFLNRLAEDQGRFGAFFDSTFAAERLGEYTLEFQAIDLSEERSAILTTRIYLENMPPRLFNIELPDTVQRPDTGVEIVVVRVAAEDPQGLSDIDSVNVVVQRTGGQPSTIQLFDDGDFENNRDEFAEDGIYSRGLTVDRSSTAGIFFFTFRARDKADNTSAVLTDSLVILP